jgi:hypothetical protein
MARLMVAISLYVGVLLLFVVIVISLLHSSSMLTAVVRGMAALGVFAILGAVAGLGSRVSSGTGDY